MDQAFVPPWTKDLLHPGAGRRSLKSLQSLEEKLMRGGARGAGVLGYCQGARRPAG